MEILTVLGVIDGVEYGYGYGSRDNWEGPSVRPREAAPSLGNESGDDVGDS